MNFGLCKQKSKTLEQILPGMEKVIVEPGTASVLPYLPLGRARDGGLR